MSYNITGTTITLTRGDTFEALVSATKRDGTHTIKITTLAQLKVALQAAKTYIDGQIGGLGTLAGKSEVAYDDLAAALKTLIDGKAAQATVDTVKTFSKDYKTVTTVYANGNQLVKTFSDDMKTITSVLTDSEGTVIATETKTLSDDGLTISTDVVYG